MVNVGRGRFEVATRTQCDGGDVLKQRSDQHGGMHGHIIREVANLMPARCARRDDHRAERLVANCRQQLPLADRARHFVVVARVPERPGHATTAGIEIHHPRAGNRRTGAPSTLPEVPSISGDSGRGEGCAAAPVSSPRSDNRVQHRLFEEHAGCRDDLCLAPGLASSAARARLRARRTGSSARRRRWAGPQRRADRARRRSARQGRGASASSPFEICGRPQQPLAASAWPKSCGSQDVEGRQPDLRVVVVRERVV